MDPLNHDADHFSLDSIFSSLVFPSLELLLRTDSLLRTVKSEVIDMILWTKGLLETASSNFADGRRQAMMKPTPTSKKVQKIQMETRAAGTNEVSGASVMREVCW
jgi:hypothetical protein